MFRAIASDNFPPFGKFRMDFPPVENRPADVAEVHLLTGVNGTGKTRLLTLLAAVLGNPAPLVKRLKGVTKEVSFGVTDSAHKREQPLSTDPFFVGGGVVGWAPGSSVHDWAQSVPAFAYNGTAYVSDAAIQVMAGVPKPDRAACLSFSRPEQHSGQLLQAIANLEVQAGLESMRTEADERPNRAMGIIQGLERTLTEITGQPFAFQMTAYPQPALSAKWGNSELPFDLLADGLRAIIGWLVDAVVMTDAWLEGKGSTMDTEAVFLLDEVESHLHPVWQRRVVPAFQRLWPKAQIFVASHSPFVISSVNHGWVHPLTLEPDGKVKVRQPVPASAGDSYISVLEDIMGLQEWYDPDTEKLLGDFRAERERAYQGQPGAKAKALHLAEQLGERSMELRYMMGRELSQMERQLGKAEAK